MNSRNSAHSEQLTDISRAPIFNHGSLFSGIGGFDLAAEWMGWENVFHCEWNEFGQRILKYHWPKAISYEDITKTDFSIHRGQIDILTGGFPCQPYSSAGKRLGKEDDRHLWPEMLRAIREIQPRWVVGENVYGIINWNGGLVFNEVQVDLENEGYEVQPVLLPACGINAPHKRERIWFVAYSRSKHSALSIQQRGQDQTKNINPDREGKERITTNTGLQRPQKRQEQSMGVEQLCEKRLAPNPSNERLQGRKLNGTSDTQTKEQREQPSGSTSERHQITDWQQWPTQSPICSGDDGFSPELDGITFPKWRNESIKAYGNAIVPQVAYQIFQAINACEMRL